MDPSKRRLRIVRLHDSVVGEAQNVAATTAAERLEMMWPLHSTPGLSRGNPSLNSDFRDILSAFIAEGVEFLLVGDPSCDDFDSPSAA